jgi:hypothetical protein
MASIFILRSKSLLEYNVLLSGKYVQLAGKYQHQLMRSKTPVNKQKKNFANLNEPPKW